MTVTVLTRQRRAIAGVARPLTRLTHPRPSGLMDRRILRGGTDGHGRGHSASDRRGSDDVRARGDGRRKREQERTGHRPEPGREPCRGHARRARGRRCGCSSRPSSTASSSTTTTCAERRRHGDRHRVRQRGRARCARGRRATTSAPRSRARRLARAGRGPSGGRAAENRAESRRRGRHVGIQSHQDEVVILRVDYFENRDGRFLSVEAKTRERRRRATGSTYVGPDARAVLEHAAPARRSTRRRGSCRRTSTRTRRRTPTSSTASSSASASPARTSPAAAHADPRRLEHRRVQGGRRRRLARRRAAADGDDLPEGLHDALHRPDRALRRVREARGRVPEHRRADHAAEQDQRLPAARAGDHGRRRPAGQHAGTRRGAEGAVVLTSRAWGHEGGNDISAEFLNPSASRARR